MPDSTSPYTVVLLLEDELTDHDARTVVDLSSEMRNEGTKVRYHVLLPAEGGSNRGAVNELAERHTPESDPESSHDSRPGGYGTAGVGPQDDGADADDSDDSGDADDERLTASLDKLRGLGVDATGEVTRVRPVDALQQAVAGRHGDEVIILTEEHVVAEFLHTDWSSSARRRLDVPVLHLIERSGPGETGDAVEEEEQDERDEKDQQG